MVGLAIVPPIAVAAVMYGRFVRKITREVQDSLAEATKVAEERIANMRTVKTFSKESREMESYKSCIQEVLRLGYKETKARALFYGMVSTNAKKINGLNNCISVLYSNKKYLLFIRV